MVEAHDRCDSCGELLPTGSKTTLCPYCIDEGERQRGI